MAKQRSEKSSFPSRYDGGWVSPAQYLVECLCVLIAKCEKKNLQSNFWNNEPWKAVFRRQVPLAVKLLKEYPAKVILAAMRDRRCWKMRSFGARFMLDPLLKEKMREHKAQESQQSGEIMEKTSTVQKPQRVKRGKKSLFAILKDI